MGGAVVSRLIILGAGTLYPAYSSYKAVKSANVRQYVRWMMYWVVFALYITIETFTDLLLSWVPFYYEIKVGFIIWLLSPYTKGAAFLYRKFIHPMLAKREPEIDRFLSNARNRSYATMVDVGSRGINVAANAVVTAAVKGQAVVSDRLKSFSVNDISQLPDETPIHSMNPSLHNPPIQREMLRGTAHEPRFEMGEIPLTRAPLHNPQANIDMNMYMSNGASAEVLLPPSGAVTSPGMRRSPGRHPGAAMPPSVEYHTNIGSQYKAYSMMNLGDTRDQGHIMTRTIQYTTAPPETSVDDSVIPDHHDPDMGDDREYSTLPRQRKHRKHKKEKDPSSSSSSSSVRRSKRKAKASSYHEEGSGNEFE